jgi:hypothetical protein
VKRLFGWEIHALGEISNPQTGTRRNNLPRVGLVESRKDAHERSLARTVRTDQPDPLACADVEIDILLNWLDAKTF